MAKRLSSEQDAQRALYAFYRGREDQETGKPFPQSIGEFPELIKGSMRYRALYSGGYHLDVDKDDIDNLYGKEH